MNYVMCASAPSLHIESTDSLICSDTPSHVWTLYHFNEVSISLEYNFLSNFDPRPTS